MSTTPEEQPGFEVGTPEDDHNPIVSFELKMKLDCTISINGTDWFKPGVEGAIRWKHLPDENDIQAAATYIQFHVIDPTISDAISHITERIKGQPRR